MFLRLTTQRRGCLQQSTTLISPLNQAQLLVFWGPQDQVGVAYWDQACFTVPSSINFGFYLLLDNFSSVCNLSNQRLRIEQQTIDMIVCCGSWCAVMENTRYLRNRVLSRWYHCNKPCIGQPPGKTTLLRLIAGLEEVTDGRIYFDGECCVSLWNQNTHANEVHHEYARKIFGKW